MRKYLFGTLLLSAILLFYISQAQQSKPKKKVVYKGKSLLSDSVTGSGNISVKHFKNLLGKGLIALDSANKPHAVISFIFMYAERGAFEDSTGKLRVMSDNFSIQCDSGKLPNDWVKSFSERSKAGDTAYFSNIISSYDDSGRKHFYTEPLKLILTD